MTLENFKSGFQSIKKIEIAWGEMDAFQHVNNAAYFRYFESARIEYFSELNMMEAFQVHKVGPVLAETSCKYIRPLNYPDEIYIGVNAVKDSLQKDRFMMAFSVYSTQQQTITTKGNALIVFFDFNSNRPHPLPEVVIKAVNAVPNQTSGTGA
jgi:acyl-CoA thioester hydrolase